MSEKRKYPRAVALDAAREVIAALRPVCLEGRIIVAGSLRRRRLEVGDVEIIYVSRYENRQVPGDMFKRHDYDLADIAIDELESAGVLAKRESIIGSITYGPKNKLMRHVRTGVPVDLFLTNETNWDNYLVCRTGPKESNIALANAARDRGWKWTPYGSGFVRADGGDIHPATSERDVFEFVGINYKEPWER